MATTPLQRAALALNVAILVPLLASLARDAPSARAAYGPPSSARAILSAVYTSILAVSVGLLVFARRGWSRPATVALLTVQAVYKVLTPLTTGDLGNVVVRWNLGVAAFQAFVITQSLRAG